MAAGAAVTLYVGRGLTFTVDELVFFADSPNLDLQTALEPHGGHLTLTSRVVYKVVLEVFGSSYLAVPAAHGCGDPGRGRPAVRLLQAPGRRPGRPRSLPGPARLRIRFAALPERQRLHRGRLPRLRNRRAAGGGARRPGGRPRRLRACSASGSPHTRRRSPSRLRSGLPGNAGEDGGAASGSRSFPPPSTPPGGCGRVASVGNGSSQTARLEDPPRPVDGLRGLQRRARGADRARLSVAGTPSQGRRRACAARPRGARLAPAPGARCPDTAWAVLAIPAVLWIAGQPRQGPRPRRRRYLFARRDRRAPGRCRGRPRRPLEQLRAGGPVRDRIGGSRHERLAAERRRRQHTQRLHARGQGRAGRDRHRGVAADPRLRPPGSRLRHLFFPFAEVRTRGSRRPPPTWRPPEVRRPRLLRARARRAARAGPGRWSTQALVARWG